MHSYSSIWNQVHTYFTDFIFQLTPQTAIFGIHNIDKDTSLIQNHLLLLFKLHMYYDRKYGFLSVKIRKIKTLEKRIAANNSYKYERFRKKWHKIENKIS